MIIRILTAAISGLLFGAGLYIAQMTDPTKVLAFLDLSLMATGQWDPSLILVMGGGFAVMALAHLVRRFGMKKALFDISFRLPDTKDISSSLLWGSALFGLGWGLAMGPKLLGGLCWTGDRQSCFSTLCKPDFCTGDGAGQLGQRLACEPPPVTNLLACL